MEGILNMTETMKRKIIICSMAVLFACFSATASFASWSQSFNENGIYGPTTYNITKIEVFKLSGTSDLENPGMGYFTAGSWTVQMPNTTYVVATNATADISNFNWLFSFTGTSADSVHLAYLVYTSDDKVFGTSLDYNGASTWSYPMISNTPLTGLQINNPAYNRTSASSVPIPPAVFLFGTGLLSLVGLRKKLKA